MPASLSVKSCSNEAVPLQAISLSCGTSFVKTFATLHTKSRLLSFKPLSAVTRQKPSAPLSLALMASCKMFSILLC